MSKNTRYLGLDAHRGHHPANTGSNPTAQVHRGVTRQCCLCLPKCVHGTIAAEPKRKPCPYRGKMG